MSWADAEGRVEDEEDRELIAAPPEKPRADTRLLPAAEYVITDRFDLTQIDLDPQVGATIRITSLSRLEIMEIQRDHAPAVVSLDERGQSFLEKELHLAPGPRAMLTHRTKLLVARRVAWNDVRWYKIEFLADGDGVVP